MHNNQDIQESTADNTQDTVGSQNNTNKGNKPHNKLHIFINQIKFEEEDGVKNVMTGRELAELVPIPADNADITRKNSDDKIGLDEQIQIKVGDHFEIIRKTVQAG